MDTRKATQLTNVPGRQKRFTIETPGGDIVMVCYSLERYAALIYGIIIARKGDLGIKAEP